MLPEEHILPTRRAFLQMTTLAAGGLTIGAGRRKASAGDDQMLQRIIRVGNGGARSDLDPTALFLTVPDVQGAYTIPYIQSSAELRISADFGASAPAAIRVSLALDGRAVGEKAVSPERTIARFRDLAPGEYTLRMVGMDATGRQVSEATLTRVGVGTVIAAIGDSITEGYYGHAFRRGENLDASQFPPEAVSRDGRNFPQYAPTSAMNLPEFNCFQSWMTDLNNLLADALKQPVFIANEGWGGYKTSDYIALMETDHNWQERMRLLRPNLWLIHLGVNDERALLPAETVAQNLETIVKRLCDDYRATPARILLAKPCYDYAEGAAAILESYCAEIAKLIARLGLRPGPDFFDAYSRDKQRLYGDDPVHPTVAGMELMARLWSEAIVKGIP